MKIALAHSGLLAAVASLALAGCSVAALPTGDAAPRAQDTTERPVQLREDVELVSLPDIAERAVKGVVSVTTQRALVGRSAWTHEAFPGFPGFPEMNAPLAQGLGSGVVIDGDGHIVTNHHVVEGAQQVKVAFADGATYEATVVGSDPRSDVALLRMVDPPDDLQPLAWGDSDALRLGETVLAIGNPFGVGHTLTRGIVSAKGRARMGITEYEDFIQTDAAINPGNSGGALIDLRGRLVGIPTAIFSRSGGTQGIGFAIPASMARTLVDDLREDGRVDRGWLGVVLAEQDGGVTLAEVQEGTAAERAGLRAGDVLLAFNGTPATTLQAFRSQVALAGAGAPFEAVVLRDGKPKTVKGELDRRPDDPVR